MAVLAVLGFVAALVSAASGTSCACDIGSSFTNIAGGLSWVSSGYSGVWGVNSGGGIYYRVGSYFGASACTCPQNVCIPLSTNNGVAWQNVAGGLKKIDVGKDIVWGVNGANAIYYRDGITDSNPVGTAWVLVAGAATHVSVSDVNNAVWIIDPNGVVLYRVGSTWVSLPGPQLFLLNLDVGSAGVWGIDYNHNIYYRTGSRTSLPGTGWQLVSGGLLGNVVAVGCDTVWSINAAQGIYFRNGIQSTAQSGVSWSQVLGGLSQISVSSANNAVWGVNSASAIYARRP